MPLAEAELMWEPYKRISIKQDFTGEASTRAPGAPRPLPACSRSSTSPLVHAVRFTDTAFPSSPGGVAAH